MLAVQELEDALTYLIREAQYESFKEDILKGRLQEAEYLTFGQRCPIILPKSHVLTMLIVRDMHEKYLYQNHGDERA